MQNAAFLTLYQDVRFKYDSITPLAESAHYDEYCEIAVRVRSDQQVLIADLMS